MWKRKKLMAGLSTPPELAMSTVIATQSRSDLHAREGLEGRRSPRGRERCSQPSVHRHAAL